MIKIKNVINMKWYHWLGWGLFILSCISDGYWFLTKYHESISMDDEKDAIKIISEAGFDAYDISLFKLTYSLLYGFSLIFSTRISTEPYALASLSIIRLVRP